MTTFSERRQALDFATAKACQLEGLRPAFFDGMSWMRSPDADELVLEVRFEPRATTIHMPHVVNESDTAHALRVIDVIGAHAAAIRGEDLAALAFHERPVDLTANRHFEERDQWCERLGTRLIEMGEGLLKQAVRSRRPSDYKHGPGGKGGPGPCDPDCRKCALEREVAP